MYYYYYYYVVKKCHVQEIHGVDELLRTIRHPQFSAKLVAGVCAYLQIELNRVMGY